MVPGGQAGSSELDGEGSGQQGQEAFFPLLGLVALSYSGRGDFAPCIVRYPYCWGSGSTKTGPVVGEGTRDRGSTDPPTPPAPAAYAFARRFAWTVWQRRPTLPRLGVVDNDLDLGL